MKYLVYVLTFFFCFQVLGQDSKAISGIATYKFIPTWLTGKNKPKKKIDFFERLYENSEDIRLLLTFNDNESFFEVEERMSSNFNPSTAGRMATGGSYYTNLKDNLLIKKVDVGGEELLVSLKSSTTNQWEITNDTKVINRFKCFKATKNKTIINSKGTYNFKIEAWFAPEIPVRFGPKEFNNLPGLILELKDSHHTIYVESINFLNKAPKIKPFKGDIITEETYLKVTEENLGFFRSSIQKN